MLDGATTSPDAFVDGPTGAADAQVHGDAASDAGREADPNKLTPDCFASADAPPQLTKGSLFEGADWNDPSVLKVGTDYVMYASADRDFSGSISIYRLVSPDGKTWSLDPKTPVLTPSAAADAWDHKSVETPSVVLFDGSYHLFYTGYPVAFSDTASYRIGHAVSTDGVTFTRDAAPLMAPTCPGFDPSSPQCPGEGAPTDFHAFLVAEPGAVVFEGKLAVYFSASGYDSTVMNPLFTVGRITSSDGRTWSAAEQVLIPDQTLHPRSTWLGYSTPAAIALGGELHLFFDVVQDMPFAQLALHHARSLDGKSGFVIDKESIYTTQSFDWASREIRAPTALLDDRSLRLWFAGDDGTTLGIGEAACAL